MEMHFGDMNWLAIGVCVVVGQVFLTLWFVALFGTPWAKEYGVNDMKTHTAAIPPWTYAVGALCVFLVTMGLAELQ